MALHGIISVNDHALGAWSAVCLGRQPDGYADYAWETLMTAPPAHPSEARVGVLPTIRLTGRLTHRYADGALVLAAKVLAAATAERDPDLEAPAHD